MRQQVARVTVEDGEGQCVPVFREEGTIVSGDVLCWLRILSCFQHLDAAAWG